MERFKQQLQWLFCPENNLKDNEDGQILVLTALSGLALVMMVSTIFNIGMVTGEKMKVQNAADAAAYSQAVWEARTLNFLAYTNRAIISHMVTIAFATAVISQKELWYWINTIASAIPPPPGPFIQSATQIVYNIWQGLASVAPWVQRGAKIWIDFCQALQLAVMTDYVVTAANGNLGEKIAQDFDPAIRMSRAINQAGLPYFKNLTRYPAKSEMDFESFRQVYLYSMDGFSGGSSFPRKAGVGKPWLGFEVGFEGKVDVAQDSMSQKENFFVGVLWGCLTWYGKPEWCFEKRNPVIDVPYYGLKLGSFTMFNAQKQFVRGENPALAVFSYAKKRSTDIPQIPLLGTATDRDIKVLASAEVFYWDPGNRTLEPNLFNPFWHARLAPAQEKIQEILPYLPEILFGNFPLTH